MSPDPPGVAAPPDPATDAGGRERRATFRPGAEQVDETTTQEPAPAAAAPVAPAPAARRRFLDDPNPDEPRAPRRTKVRARKVRRIVRHVEPWSVLKISVLFFLSMFLIICVASALLWNAARSAGAIDDVESFITSLGFGNCEDIDGETGTTPDSPPSTIDGTADQLGVGEDPSTTVPVAPPEETSTLPDRDGECREGQRLVGGFKFEDQRILQAFGLGGVVLVLAGAAASVVMAMLFNLISDLTGGVRVTVLEEEPSPPRRSATGSPTVKTSD